MDARQIAEALHMISRCHIEDGSVFCGNCFIGALKCDVEGITDWLVSEAD
jgi:hypothetical protein